MYQSHLSLVIALTRWFVPSIREIWLDCGTGCYLRSTRSELVGCVGPCLHVYCTSHFFFFFLISRCYRLEFGYLLSSCFLVACCIWVTLKASRWSNFEKNCLNSALTKIFLNTKGSWYNRSHYNCLYSNKESFYTCIHPFQDCSDSKSKLEWSGNFLKLIFCIRLLPVNEVFVAYVESIDICWIHSFDNAFKAFTRVRSWCDVRMFVRVLWLCCLVTCAVWFLWSFQCTDLIC